MLETPNERIKLLRAGINGTTIEKIYVVYNNLNLVKKPLLFEFDKVYVSYSDVQAVEEEK